MNRVEGCGVLDRLQATLRPYEVINDRWECPPCFLIRIHEKSRSTLEDMVFRRSGEGDWDFWNRTLDVVSRMTTDAFKRAQGDPHYRPGFQIYLYADHSGVPNDREARKRKFIELLWEFAKGDNIDLRLYALGVLADYYSDD